MSATVKLTKMDPEWKTKWIAALRSGNYTQARKVLCRRFPNNQRTYCCLGVLCDLVAPDKWQDTTLPGDYPDDEVEQISRHQHCDHYPGWDVEQATGLRPEAQRRCGMLNDAEHLNFEEIAAWIEEHL